jgi:hypothetical protein
MVDDASEDSDEAERSFRKEAERHSGMIPNPSERSGAGCSIGLASSGETCPEAKERPELPNRTRQERIGL